MSQDKTARWRRESPGRENLVPSVALGRFHALEYVEKFLSYPSAAEGKPMTAVLLLILGSSAAVAVLYVCVMAFLHRGPGKLSFIGQVPVAPLPPWQPNPPAFMRAQVRERRAADQANTWCVSGLTKHEAED